MNKNTQGTISPEYAQWAVGKLRKHYEKDFCRKRAAERRIKARTDMREVAPILDAMAKMTQEKIRI